MTRTTTLIALIAILTAPLAHAGDETPAMNRAIDHYAAIGDALAADTVDGVAEHASQWLDLVKSHAQDGAHHAHSEAEDTAHGAMKSALESMKTDDLDLESARAAFTELSQAFVPMAKSHYQKTDADPDWAVMHCPMAPGNGDWIQEDGKLANPYYGSRMLRCGKKVGDLTALASGEHGEDHGGGGGHHGGDHDHDGHH